LLYFPHTLSQPPTHSLLQPEIQNRHRVRRQQNHNPSQSSSLRLMYLLRTRSCDRSKG
jgi:hypothetical protein